MAHHSNSHKLPYGAAKLCNDLAALINNRQGSDIQFKVGGGIPTHQENGETIYNDCETVTIYAHSVILRCRSRYFATMLDEDKHWKESSNGIIYKPNISPDVFQDVLRYIYTGDICIKNSESIIDLITAADEMDLEELRTECEADIIRIAEDFFSNENDGGNKNRGGETFGRSTKQQIPIDVVLRKYIIPSLNLADSHLLSYLSQKLQAIILPRMSVIVKSPDAYILFINDISSDAFHKIISSDYLALEERDIWDLAFSWGCHQVGISKVTVEAQLSNLEDEDGDVSINETVISTTQLDQLKKRMAPLLPAIRFSLLDHDDYHQMLGVLNYFLSRHRSLELNRLFIKPDCTKSLDKPRSGTIGSKIFSNIIVESTVWKLLRKNIFETGGINSCSSSDYLKFRLLFRASGHGFGSVTFHRHCDNKGPTLVVVKSADGHLFGGVNFNHWKSDLSYSSSSLNFLFALPDGSHRKDSVIFRIDPTRIDYSTFNSLSRGPIFGAMMGNDLIISDFPNTNYNSFSNLPCNYNGSGASNTALAGAKNFKVSEYEVFAISI